MRLMHLFFPISKLQVVFSPSTACQQDWILFINVREVNVSSHPTKQERQFPNKSDWKT